jgi:molybdate transport system substrate-binding protein
MALQGELSASQRGSDDTETMMNEPAAMRGASCADTPLRSSLRLLGIASMATRDLLANAVADWEGRGGIGVDFEAAGGVDAARRVRDAEPFDVVVLAAEAIEQLAAVGRLVAGSTTALARSTVAIAVRRGAARPDIGSEDALRAAVLSARNVGCSTGPSGVALRRLFERWGITDQIGSRIVQAPPGVPVGALLLRGDVELGFQQLSELMHLDGIEVIGPMPPGLEIVTTFSGAVCAASVHADEARRLLDFIRSPAVDAARCRHGMQAA